MARRKGPEHCQINTTAKGIYFQLPKSEDLSPIYSRSQLKQIIADLQDALDHDMFRAR